MEKYRTSSLNTTYPLTNNHRFLNTGPLYTMGNMAANLPQQHHGPQLLMNTNSVGTATQFQFVPARHQHTATIQGPYQFDIGNSFGPIFNSVKTFFSNLLKPTIRPDTMHASDTATEKRKCNSAPNIYVPMGNKSDGKCAGDLDKSCFVDTVDYETLAKLSASTKSFSDYNLPTAKASSCCSSVRSTPESVEKILMSESFEEKHKTNSPATKESSVKKSPPPSPIAVPLPQSKSNSVPSINELTVPIMTRRSDKKRPAKEKSNRKAKRRSGKNQKEKGKHALAQNIHEDCATETETMSTDEWDEPLVIIPASATAPATPPSIQPSPVTFSSDDFPAMPTPCPLTQTLPRLSHCVAALIGKRPQRQVSECDSEDSFIVFDNDDKFTPSSVESNPSMCERIRGRLAGRQRQLSESSDDDFICFEMEDSDGDGDEDSDDDDDEDDVDGALCDDDEDALTSVSDCESEVDGKSSGTNPPDSGFEDKKVRFNLKPVIHVLRTWSFAYQQARKGEWEQYGRDRVRFHDRIKRLEATLVPVLNSDHRQKIYCDRFRQTAVNDTCAVESAIVKQ